MRCCPFRTFRAIILRSLTAATIFEASLNRDLFVSLTRRSCNCVDV